MPPKTLINHSDFFKECNALQNQFIYLILSLNTASIGYALTRLEKQSWTWSLLPLGIALVAWITSVMMGMRFIQAKKDVILLEVEHLDANDLMSNTAILEQVLIKLSQNARRL